MKTLPNRCDGCGKFMKQEQLESAGSYTLCSNCKKDFDAELDTLYHATLDNVKKSEFDIVRKHKCLKCNGTGIYIWTRNDGSKDHGTCFQCEGKGYTTARDRERTRNYWEIRLNNEIRNDLGGV